MIENEQFDTVYIREELYNCESDDDFMERIRPMIKGQREEWKLKIKEIIDSLHCNKSGFSNKIGISRQNIQKWFDGSIPRRETLILIGLAAGYDIDGISGLIKRYGPSRGLYSKTLEDCICMYVVNNYPVDERIEKYNEIYKRFAGILKNEPNGDKADITTAKFDKKVMQVKSEEELEEFLSSHLPFLRSAYNKFYSFANTFIEDNFLKFKDGENEVTVENVHGLALQQGWSASLINAVSEIRQNKWIPKREKIISLGVHLCMDVEQIDDMLGLVYMEPLCAKDIIESVVIYVVNDAYHNNVTNSNSDNYDPDALYNRLVEVLRKLDVKEAESFINEFAEEE